MCYVVLGPIYKPVLMCINVELLTFSYQIYNPRDCLHNL